MFYFHLVALIQKLELSCEDEIYFLGDYIDRGPKSKEVIDYIIELKQKFNVFCLKGNHEEMYEDKSTKDLYKLKDINGDGVVDVDDIAVIGFTIWFFKVWCSRKKYWDS